MPRSTHSAAARAVIAAVDDPPQVATAIEALIEEMDPYYLEGVQMISVDDLRALAAELTKAGG